MKIKNKFYAGVLLRLLSSFILLASLLVLPKVQAAVGDNFIDGNFKYTVLSEEGTSGTVSVGKQSDALPSGAVAIPAAVSQGSVTYSVTSVLGQGFQDCNNLTSVTIPESVTEIKFLAFSGCSSLMTITIPDSVTSIEERAFYECPSLTNAVIGNGVHHVGDEAFAGCNNLASAVMGNGVTSIGAYAFARCGNLAGIIIPDTVTSIGEWAFSSCSCISSITIPNSVTHIGKGAFAGCGLTNLEIPDSVTVIGDVTFASCRSLADIMIPDSITSIGNGAFMDCRSLAKITIPNSVRSIEQRAFQDCRSLESIMIPNSVTNIGAEAFEDCDSLTSIIISNGVTGIWNEAFNSCNSLTSVIFKGNAPEAGLGIFNNCPLLKTIYYVEGTTGWTNPWASVETVGLKQEDIFISSSPVNRIVLPDTKVSFEVSAYSLSDLSYQWYKDGAAIDGETDAFFVIESAQAEDSGSYKVMISNEYASVSKEATLRVITERTGDPDSDFKYSINAGVVSITDYLGTNKNVAIPNIVEGYLVTSIGIAAFSNLSTLESITIPNSVTSIGASSFANCPRLTEITIPDSVTSIGASAFSTCAALKIAMIGNGLTSVGFGVFTGCTSLTLVVFKGDAPGGIVSIFTGCTALKTIYYIEGTSGWTNPWSFKATAVLNQEDIFILSAPVYQIVLQNTKVSLEVSAFSLSQLSYQWYKDGSSIEGATTPVYFIESAQVADSGSYTVTISSEYASVSSKEATLDVIAEGTGDPDSDFQYSISGGVATITGYLGTNTNVTIPYFIDGCLVSSIGSKAFAKLNTLESITIPDTVISIPETAFLECSNLKSVKMSKGTTSIGRSAFAGCSNLASIIIPENVTSIGVLAFSDCSSLRRVFFMGDAPSIGSYVFAGCSALSAIYYMEGTEGWTNPPWDSLRTVCLKQEDILIISNPVNQTVLPNTDVSFAVSAYSPSALSYQWYKDGVAIEGATGTLFAIESAQVADSGSYTVTISNGHASASSKQATLRVVTERTGDPDSDFQYTLNKRAASITGYLGTNVNVVIPNIVEGCLVTRIDDSAFIVHSNLTSITIPAGVTSIGSCAFSFCSSLTSIVIPDSVTSIEYGALHSCSNLTDIIIPDGVSSIEDTTFAWCSSLRNIIIPDSVTSIGAWVFGGCSSLTSIIIPDSVTSIGNSAFSDCSSLKSLYFKGNAPIMGYNVFSGCDALEIIYYMDGMSGWTNPWQEIATATWSPEESTTLSFEVVAGKLILTYSGGSLEASSDLILWNPVEGAQEGKYELDIPSTGKTFYRVAQ